MKIIAYLKLFIKKFNQFDNWLSRPRVKRGELFYSESYMGVTRFIIFALLSGFILWSLPELLNESNIEKKKWIQFWAIVLIIPPILVSIWKLAMIYLKRNHPQKHDEIIQAIETNQSKTLELHKQQTLSKSIEDEIGKIEVPKAIPTSLTIEKTDDTPHPPLAPKSTRPGDKD
jgi:hypothetical protein